jgi:hypothetical protein
MMLPVDGEAAEAEAAVGRETVGRGTNGVLHITATSRWAETQAVLRRSSGVAGGLSCQMRMVVTTRREVRVCARGA